MFDTKSYLSKRKAACFRLQFVKQTLSVEPVAVRGSEPGEVAFPWKCVQNANFGLHFGFQQHALELTLKAIRCNEAPGLPRPVCG